MLSDDLAAAAHIFGYIAVELHFFQVIGAVVIFLAVWVSIARRA